MRHRKKFNHLGRKTAHRKSMFANMACSLIEHKRINTTTAKAKALRQFIEPIITRSKVDTTDNRRKVFAKLRQKEAVTELFREVAAKIGDRPGGYTRVIKLGNRLGDNADMAMIELVDYNDTYTTEKPQQKTRRSGRRRGSGKSKKKETATVANEAEDKKTEAKAAETPAKPEDTSSEKAKQPQTEKKTAEKQEAEPKAEGKDKEKQEAKIAESKPQKEEKKETEASENKEDKSVEKPEQKTEKEDKGKPKDDKDKK